jgi:hypothetical protein
MEASLWRTGRVWRQIEGQQRPWWCLLVCGSGVAGCARSARVRTGMQALNLNVVLQREESLANGKFEFLIVTNILVYYDTFELSLALANIQTMLRPGGILLTNNLLLELPSSKMKSVDYVSVEYSTRETDGDRILWYCREL